MTDSTQYGPTSCWSTTVSDWFETLTVCKSTLNSYRSALKSLSYIGRIRTLRDMQPLRLAPLMVARWEPSTRMKIATILRQFWEHTEMPVPKPGWRRFRKSLSVGVRKREPLMVQKVDFEAALRCAKPRLALFFELLWETGVRLNEGLHLRVDDVSVEAGTIHVHPHDGPVPWNPKSKAADRFIPTTLAARLIDEALGEYVFVRPARVRYLRAYDKTLHERSTAMWPRVRDDWNLAIDRSGVTHFRPHDLRHTRLTLWATGTPSMSLKNLQYLAGHSDVRTTLQIYAHVVANDAIDQARNFLPRH